MANYRSDLHDIHLFYLHHTEMAVLVTDGINEAWLPKSQCEFDPDPDTLSREDPITVTAPEWVLKSKDII